MQTIHQKFFETAQTFPGRSALKYKHQNAYLSISFSELENKIKTLAKGFFNLGLKKGERLAILSENRPEWVMADLAALSLGAVVVPVHTTLSPGIIKHILENSGSRMILVSSQEQFNKLLLVAKEISGLEAIIYANLDQTDFGNLSQKIISFNEVLNSGQEIKTEMADQVQAGDLASIIYTSGTTALPKGVMLTHHNLMFDAEAAVTAVAVDEKDILLSFLPLSHVLERTAGYYAPLVCRGSCIAYAESPKTLVNNLREIKPTILVAVPRIFEKVHVSIWDKVKNGSKLKYQIFIWALKQEPKTFTHYIADRLVFKKIRQSLGGRLRYTISGGATLNHRLARFFARLGLVITEGYGLTETAPIISVNRLNNIKFGTVGQQLPGVEIKIALDKEILVRGPNVMAGYYNNSAMTQEVIDAEGWFHTGDLGFLSSEGFLIIIGRKKEMISLSNGKIAWPEQIELLLNDDRFFAQSMVLGDGRSYLTAVIVPDWQEIKRNAAVLGLPTLEPASLVSEPKLIKTFYDRIEKINNQLAEWERIRKIVLLPDEFSQEKDELTPTLKLRRHIIENHYQSQIDKLY
ncbi:MAG: long-chain fatty acid--CoA ligase [Candidatus Buchananbacteria bacterium]